MGVGELGDDVCDAARGGERGGREVFCFVVCPVGGGRGRGEVGEVGRRVGLEEEGGSGLGGEVGDVYVHYKTLYI